MYTLEEFDNAKTKMLKYILYKKRTEYEIRVKFNNTFKEEIIEEAIIYLKEAGYIDDNMYIEKAINEIIALKTLSIKEIKYKLEAKGLKRIDIEKYIDNNYDELYEYEKKCASKLMSKKNNSMDEYELKNYLLKKGYKEESLKN